MQDHLVFFATARTGGIPFLVRVNCHLGFIHIDEDISLLLLWRRRVYYMWGFGGAHYLALIVHVALMGFL